MAGVIAVSLHTRDSRAGRAKQVPTSKESLVNIQAYYTTLYFSELILTCIKRLNISDLTLLVAHSATLYSMLYLLLLLLLSIYVTHFTCSFLVLSVCYS